MPAFDLPTFMQEMRVLAPEVFAPQPTTEDVINSFAPPQARMANIPAFPQPAEPSMGQAMAQSFVNGLRAINTTPSPIALGAPAGLDSRHSMMYNDMVNQINANLMAEHQARQQQNEAVRQAKLQEEENARRAEAHEIDKFQAQINAEKAKRDLEAPDPLEMATYETKIKGALDDRNRSLNTQQDFLRAGVNKSLGEQGLAGDKLRADIDYTNALKGAAGRRGTSGGKPPSVDYTNVNPDKLFKGSDGEPLNVQLLYSTGVREDDEMGQNVINTLARIAANDLRRGLMKGKDEAEIRLELASNLMGEGYPETVWGEALRRADEMLSPTTDNDMVRPAESEEDIQNYISQLKKEGKSDEEINEALKNSSLGFDNVDISTSETRGDKVIGLAQGMSKNDGKSLSLGFPDKPAGTNIDPTNVDIKTPEGRAKVEEAGKGFIQRFFPSLFTDEAMKGSRFSDRALNIIVEMLKPGGVNSDNLKQLKEALKGDATLKNTIKRD